MGVETKGHISPRLATVLRDRTAVNRLRESLAKGHDVTVRVGDTVYRATTHNNIKFEPEGSENKTDPPKD